MTRTSLKRIWFMFLFTSTILFADTELVIVEGKMSHSPKDSVPPPTEAALIEMAKADAMKQLTQIDNYQQVSSWMTTSLCKPTYRGADTCYEGEATAKASFVARTDLRNAWSVTTESTVHWHAWDKSSSEVLAEVEENAKQDARFFCNGEITLPALNEMRETRVEIEECRLATYRGTFRCLTK